MRLPTLDIVERKLKRLPDPENLSARHRHLAVCYSQRYSARVAKIDFAAKS
jgi:hypothetical protein